MYVFVREGKPVVEPHVGESHARWALAWSRERERKAGGLYMGIGPWGLEVVVVGLYLLGRWPTSFVGYCPAKMGLALGLDLSHHET